VRRNERPAALLLRDTNAGILLNEHVAGDGPTVFEHACRLGAEGIVSKRADGHLSIRVMRGLDQGPQSRQRRDAEGAQRELEHVIPGAEDLTLEQSLAPTPFRLRRGHHD
jgi:hypothetical protein